MNKGEVLALRSAIKVGLLAGLSAHQIAEMQQCSVRTVQKVRQLLDRTGDVQDGRQRNPGRPVLYEEHVAEQILRAREQTPYFGERHLHAVLARDPARYQLSLDDVPSPAYIGRVLRRHGLAKKPVGPRDKRIVPDAKPTAPGTVTIDTWGPWHIRATPLVLATAQDRYTRFALAIPGTGLRFARQDGAKPGVGSQLWATAIWAARRYLVPQGLARLYTDNGAGMVPAFGALPLAVRYALSLGATVVFIPPGQPWRNGRLERFHWTMEREYFRVDQPPTVRAAHLGLTEWINYHNEDRPHTAWHYRAPAEANAGYRRLPAEFWQGCDIQAPFPPQAGTVEAIRLVLDDGTVETWGQRLRLSPDLAGQFVRLVFDVTGEVAAGRVLYQQRKGIDVEVATFTHTLDALGHGGTDWRLYHDVVPVDLVEGRQNQGIGLVNYRNQQARVLKRRKHDD